MAERRTTRSGTVSGHGIVRLIFDQLRRGNKDIKAALPSPPISCRNHQPLRLVVFTVRFELPGCGRDHGRARRDSLVRNHSRLVSAIRRDLCETTAPPERHGPAITGISTKSPCRSTASCPAKASRPVGKTEGATPGPHHREKRAHAHCFVP